MGGTFMKEYVTQPLISVAEAARFLGVARKLIYQLIEFGEIRAVKSGRAVLIELDSLVAFQASGKML
jgi:excisionase family DNA binding protein